MRKFYLMTTLTLLSLWGMVSGLKAQSSANYSFAASTTGSLVLDMNSNTVDMSAGTTLLDGPSADQGNAAGAVQNIGFNFIFGGSAYTQFSATTNGIITLGSTAASGSNYAASGGSVASPRISAFAADLGTGATIGKTHYKLVGTAPNRTLVIEFKDMALLWTNTYVPSGTWQVRLYETTGVVEYVYGAMSIGSTGSASDASVGIGFSWGTAANQFAYITSATNTNTTSGSFTDNPTYAAGPITNLNSAADGSRTIYRWTPPAAPTAPGGLTFPLVGATAMTMSWTDNASNEITYAIQRSTDNINFTTIASLPANSTSYLATGLTVSTLYYWKVLALSEGASSEVAGSQATLAAPPCTITGTIPVGPTGTYSSLSQAFTALTLTGVAGPVILELQAAYLSSVETFPITINAIPCASAVNNVTVRPETGATALSITSANTTATIDINGGQFVTFDGRAGGAGASQLTISNTSTSGPAIRFINEASNNTVNYCTLRSANTGLSSGTVFFSTTTGANGNDNNTIANNDIADGATTPTIGIFSSGTTATAAQNNSNNTVSNNNIFNFYNSTSTTSGGIGVSLSSGSTDWTISNNSFYQTATRTTFGNGATWNGILISNGGGNNFSITGNSIGGTAPACGGTALTLNTTATLVFRAIQMTVGAVTPSSVQGNTIQNIAVTTASTSSAQSLISLVTGSINCGTVTGNTLGSPTAVGNISFTTSGSGAIFTGILAGTGTPSTIVISNNTIGGISTANSGTPATALSTRGISFQGAAVSNTVSNNTVGSLTTAGSLTSSANGGMLGIFGASTAATNNISGNTVANLSQTGTGTGNQLIGILAQGTSGGAYSTTGNTVRNLVSASASTGSGSGSAVLGISATASTTAGQTVAQNTVHSLSNTNTGVVNISVTGIFYTGPSTGPNLIARNFVHSLSQSSTGTVPFINGINIGGGTSNIQNNMVRLGIDASGAAITGNYSMNGINDGTGTNNYFHNSVYIGGSSSGTLKTFAFASSVTLNTRSFRNNIFVNERANSTGNHSYAIALGGTFPNPSGLTVNNNLYYVNGAGTAIGRGISAAVDYLTLANWQTGIGQDAASITGNPQYINATGNAASADLHLNTLLATPAEGNGSLIASVTDDFDGQTRSGLTPVDIGADAGNFISAGDLVPPVIAFAPLPNGVVAASRTANNFATITDNVGVSASPNGPRIYYKKSTDANAFAGNTSADNGWKYVTASNASSPYSFNIDYTIINGGTVSVGDVIQYFVVAQDDNNNLASLATGATASGNPPVQNINLAPATPNSYTIVASLSGIYTVGSGGTYPTLTGAGGLFADVNAKLLTGNVEAQVIGDLSEPGTNALTQAGLNGFNLRIVPSAAAVRNITNAANLTSAMIRLDSATNVTFDGSFGGSGKFFRIINTHTTASSGVAAIQFNTGSKNDTIRNCVIETNSTNSSQGSIVLGSTGFNTGIVISSNDIRDAAGTPGTVGVPAHGIYSSNALNQVQVGGATAAEGNNIFNFTAAALNLTNVGSNCIIRNNNLYQTAARGSAFNHINIGAGSGHDISDNKIYQTAGVNTGGVVAISVSTSGNGITINNNSIGGSDASRGGAAFGAASIIGIGISTGAGVANSIQGNQIGNFVTTSTSATGAGISIGNPGSFNVGTITGNTIGEAAANSISGRNTVVGIASAASGRVDIRNNTIRNLTFQDADFEGAHGINIASGSPSSLSIVNNNISGLTTRGTTAVSAPPYLFNGPSGIIVQTGAANPVISGNTISGLLADGNTAADLLTQSQSYGIVLTSSVSNATVSGNRISGMSTTRTGTGISSAPFEFGIFSAAVGANSFANNQISIGQSTTGTQPQISGIRYDAATGTSNLFAYNSVYIFGSAAAAINSYGFNKTGTVSTTLRNNIFYNERSGAGNHFAIGNASATGWNTASSNHNLYVSANSANIGEWLTVANNFAAWKTSSTADTSSYSDLNTNVAVANLFADAVNGNLSIVSANPESWYANGKGIAIACLGADFSGDSRSMIVGIPTDIGSDEFATGTTPPAATASAAPAPSTTTTYSFAGRKLGEITWGPGGTVPSAVDYRYYSGDVPPSFPSTSRFESYSEITVPDGSGYAYDIKLYYTQAEQKQLPDAALGLFKQDGVNTNPWAAILGTPSADAAGKFIATSGLLLNSFSRFTGAPSVVLPLTVLSLNGEKQGQRNQLRWTSANERNLRGYRVERSTDGIRYSEIGYVNTLAPGGNSLGNLNYAFTDNTPQGTVQYYRLKAEDINGSSRYSNVIVIRGEKPDQLVLASLYPNPAAQVLNLILDAPAKEAVTLVVTDINGRIVLQSIANVLPGTNTFSLKVAQLAAGTYTVKAVCNSNCNTTVSRFVKQ